MEKWISETLVRNIFIEKLREFDSTIWPLGSIPERSHVMELFDDIQMELLKWATTDKKTNVEKVLEETGESPEKVSENRNLAESKKTARERADERRARYSQKLA